VGTSPALINYCPADEIPIFPDTRPLAISLFGARQVMTDPGIVDPQVQLPTKLLPWPSPPMPSLTKKLTGLGNFSLSIPQVRQVPRTHVRNDYG
jgi:hypothetical protein